MYWTQKHVLVCTASHCAQKGSNELIGRLRLEVVRKKLDVEILINNCGTIDLCDIGPNVVIYPDNVILSGVTVKELAASFEAISGDALKVQEGPSRPGDVAGVYTVSSKAKDVLGWEAKLTEQEAVRDAIAWLPVRKEMLGY